MDSGPAIPSPLRRQPVPQQAAPASGSSGAAADQGAMSGAPAGLGLHRRRPGALSEQEAKFGAAMFLGFKAAASAAATAGTPAPPTPNNLENNWMVLDGVLYGCTFTVLMGIPIKDLFSGWSTWARVLYGVTMAVAACSFGGGVMALCCARMMDSSTNRSYGLYRSISGFGARFGSILCLVLLIFYITCSMGRLGWIAGILFSAVAGPAMAGLWIWAKKSAITLPQSIAPVGRGTTTIC